MLENDAFAKKHTTMSQAIDIGIKANAWRTILTHFSPRYNKVAELEKSHIEKKALIAFDHMRVSFSQLEWAYQVCKLYKILLTNDSEVIPSEKSEARGTGFMQESLMHGQTKVNK